MHAPPHETRLAQDPAVLRSAAQPSRSRWWALAFIGLAQAMLIIDVTVVNVALPSIGADLALDRAGLTWVVTSYTLMFGSFLLLGGRLTDAFGRRATFFAGLSLFTLASLGSGLAPDGTVLVAARAAQGLGAAFLAPAALSIITTTFQGNDRARALGVWAALGGSGAAIGVVLGGLLTAGPGWQWIFLVNIPVALAAAVGVRQFVESDRTEGRSGDLDLRGALAATVAVGLILFGLIGAGDAGWGSPQTVLSIGGGGVALATFVWWEGRARQPLVHLPILRPSAIGGPLMVMLIAAGLMAAAFFLSSILLQRARGLDALATGLAFVPVAIALIASAQVGAHALQRVAPRVVAAIGFGVAAIGLALLAAQPADADVVFGILPGFVVAAAGLGPGFVAATTSAFGRAGHAEAGMTSGLVNTGHEFGFALGVAVVSSVAGAAGGGELTAGFGPAYLAAAAAAVVGVVGAVTLLPATRPSMSSAEGTPRFAH
jgi:EmrB/QacA subfamily drug resistance transporter